MAHELFTLLKEDHANARHLMEEILSGQQNQRHSLFLDLKNSVQLHMQLEEQNLYPRLEGHKVLNAVQKDAVRDHQEARDLFRQLDGMDTQDNEWTNQFRRLEQGLLKHMQMEEGYVFEKCLDIFSEAQLQEIAEQCLAQKQAGMHRQPGLEQERRI